MKVSPDATPRPWRKVKTTSDYTAPAFAWDIYGPGEDDAVATAFYFEECSRPNFFGGVESEADANLIVTAVNECEAQLELERVVRSIRWDAGGTISPQNIDRLLASLSGLDAARSETA